MKSIVLDGNSLVIPQVHQVAYQKAPVALSKMAYVQMKASRQVVQEWVKSGETVYGVTTGFGEFSNVRIDKENLEELQRNLIFSHAAGAGEPLPPEIVRAMMVLRVNALAKGYSGIRPQIADLLIDMLNKDLVPVIPSQGSVGSSGDLVQLAHLVLAMMGKGRVYQSSQDEPISALRALRQSGLTPVELTAKEGLALINGTQMMAAYGALAAQHAKELCKLADIVAGISVEALRGSDTPFDERIHKLRPYKGQLASAKNLRRLMKKSQIRDSHRYNDPRVQDAYSLRCIPQVHGASRDAIEYVYDKMSVEVNSANDNPLIFPKERLHLEGGNFHGQPIALALDFLGIALSELANISERRIERLVNGSLSGLPRFLTSQGGLNSGLMIAQYTAASIVSENKVLAHPASVDSIPTSANQEDHNSMGSISAQKAWRILRNAQTVLAIELMCACQGLEFARNIDSERPLLSGKGIEAAYAEFRENVDRLDADRVLHGDIQEALRLVVDGKIVGVVEKSIGVLD